MIKTAKQKLTAATLASALSAGSVATQTSLLDVSDYVLLHKQVAGVNLKAFAQDYGTVQPDESAEGNIIRLKSNLLKASVKTFGANDDVILEKNVRYKAIMGCKPSATPPPVPTPTPPPNAPPGEAPKVLQNWWAQRVGADKVTRYAPNVLVAVLDTGCANNPYLPKAAACASFVGGDPIDKFGHGTAVGSFIHYTSHAQIAYGKVLTDQGYGDIPQIVAGVNWSVRIGAKVINLSLGSPEFSAALDYALAQARAAGVTIVAAAGNDGQPRVSHPGASQYALGVSATTIRDTLARFSNYGPEIDLSAPGENVLGLVPLGCVMCANKNVYAELMNGTSFAAPIAAGVVALSIASGRAIETDKLVDSTRFGYGIVRADITSTPTRQLASVQARKPTHTNNYYLARILAELRELRALSARQECK